MGALALESLEEIGQSGLLLGKLALVVHRLQDDVDNAIWDVELDWARGLAHNTTNRPYFLRLDLKHSAGVCEPFHVHNQLRCMRNRQIVNQCPLKRIERVL